MAKKFKAIDKKEKNIIWEGEELGVESKTKLEEDKGTGQPVILRFFDFGANPEVFKLHKPTAQELFNSHRKGIEAMLWSDGMKPFDAVQPKLMFSKDKKYYRFVIACLPTQILMERPQTLSQLLTPKI